MLLSLLFLTGIYSARPDLDDNVIKLILSVLLGCLQL